MKKIYSFILLATFSLLALGLQSCENQEEIVPDSVEITSSAAAIIFNESTSASQELSFYANVDWCVDVAGATWFTLTPLSGDAGSNTLTVEVDNTIAYVDQEATVTINAGSASVEFSVSQTAPKEASGLSISTPQRKLVLGQVLQLEIITEPLGAPITDELTWTSSDPSVISIDENGLATALALGVTVVEAEMGFISEAFEMSVTEIFTTDSIERVYTFKDLSEIAVSGVEANGTVYTVNSEFILEDNDVLSLGDATVVKFGEGVELTIGGTFDFVAGSAGVTFEPIDANTQPAGFYISSELGGGGGEVSNVTFDNVRFRYYGTDDLTFTGCTFQNIQDDSAFSLGGSGLITFEECNFIENGFPAVSCAANYTSNLIFRNNYLDNNSSSEDCSNKPQLNLTVPGDGTLEIVGNTIIGPGDYTTCGGLAFSNFYSLTGDSEILVEGNTIKDCRYGLTTYGLMKVRIVDNVIQDNKWDESAMSGGSGMSLVDYYGTQSCYLSGNTITGNLWGITIIGYAANGTGPVINLGTLDESSEDYNPGGNVFSDNGNGGVLYDLYNNSPIGCYAQGNTWGVDEQTEDNIECVIFHKADYSTLGEVVYMPTAE
ncbi:MAG: right-handed parallel beta-helix repeat-containing protein [Rikenellaceae bacterium]